MNKMLPALVLAWTMMAAAGTAQPQPARYYNPRFDGDSSRVIFESTREGKMAVYSVNVDGSGLRKLEPVMRLPLAQAVARA